MARPPETLRESHSNTANPLVALRGPATNIHSPVPTERNIDYGEESNRLTGGSDTNNESENLDQQEDEVELRHSDEEDEWSDTDDFQHNSGHLTEPANHPGALSIPPRPGSVRPPSKPLEEPSPRKKRVQNITISDDRSIGSEFELTRRILQVLKPRDLRRLSPPPPSPPPPPGAPGPFARRPPPPSLWHKNPPLPIPPSPILSLGEQDSITPRVEREMRDHALVPKPDPLSLMSPSRSPLDISSNPLLGSSLAQNLSTMNMLPHCVTSTAKAESTNAISSGKLVSLVERSTQDPLPADSGSHLDNSIDSSGHDMEPSLLSPREAMALGIPNMPALSFESLREYIQTLQKKAGVLEQMELEREPSKYQIVHRIIKSGEPALYFDKPQWFRGERNSAALKSSLPLSSVRTFLDRNPDVSFLVYRDYHLESMSCESFDELESQVHHTGECIFTSAKDLTTGVSEFLESKPALGTDNIFNGNQVLVAPYLVVYHTRHVLENTLNKVNDKQRRQLTLLFDYILSEYADVYKTVDSLLERGKINARYIKYLFKPGDILVEGREDDTRGVLATSWLDSAPGSQQPKKSMHGKSMVRWQVFASSWRFNGVFSHLKEPLHLDILDSDDSEIDISSLRLRPLAFVQEIWVERLRRRGEMFWKCRDRHFVSHHEDKGRESHHSGDERYMVDLKTYSELHPSDQKASSDWREEQIDDVGAEAMKRDSPPDSNFVFLVPVKIKAYNLKQKKWVDLRVDRLSEVVWNKEAFKSLVLDNKTKNLIQALISNQLEAENSTDLISGKGNGLILLLHGGPGTGKTLTAESVAEIAEKPLFPVTCGDIGTEPEKVEIYLESALNLGKTWGCVVLLDEADVFLEQRSLADLQRNALVSVFLRVLEYYDGILVLTSNRVGTFDEAFKSRIQLALHYANLSAYQREKIWRNFFERLRKIGVEKIDFDDLEDHLEHLSKIKMNGRQIRNSITTARQYAKWKGETLNYVMLKDIVETSGRFDVYLEKLNGGYSQDQLAEDEGIRLSETAVSDRS